MSALRVFKAKRDQQVLLDQRVQLDLRGQPAQPDPKELRVLQVRRVKLAQQDRLVLPQLLPAQPVKRVKPVQPDRRAQQEQLVPPVQMEKLDPLVRPEILDLLVQDPQFLAQQVRQALRAISDLQERLELLLR